MLELGKQDYALALPLLDQMKINTLFARAVLEGQTAGSVYADSVQNPRSFYVAHPYGMSLVFGEDDNESFNRSLQHYITNQSGQRHSPEWLQGDPAGGWVPLIDSMGMSHNAMLDAEGQSPERTDKRRIDRQTRVNFTFNCEVYLKSREQFFRQDAEIVQMTGELFLAQAGAVIPRFFWRDEEHFLASGIGYTLLWEGENASTAFAAYRTEEQLEIGIESAAAYRGQRFAFSACAALIDYCLEHGLEPVWGCRLENEASYKLAQKLGFQPSLKIPYYRLAE